VKSTGRNVGRKALDKNANSAAGKRKV